MKHNRFIFVTLLLFVQHMTGIAQPKAVDMGLSVKWASCNVGATSPSEYGDYYAWGETATKSDYTWKTYKWCDGSSDTFTKYFFPVEDKTDDKSADKPKTKTLYLEYSDDVARQKWGGEWRIPTDKEWMELQNNCTWEWTSQSGVFGYKVTSKKNGNNIFLPAAGYKISTGFFGAGDNGGYWSSSLTPDGHQLGAWRVYFNSRDICGYDHSRFMGRSVRPVL